MSPAPNKRNAENKGLPARWRIRFGKYYYYRVPPGEEDQWDGKKEFPLGKSLAEAYRTFSERIDYPEDVDTMEQLMHRYRLEVIPTKAVSTQKVDLKRLENLRIIFGDSPANQVTTQDCYKILDNFTRNRGPRVANHHIALLSHIFTYAIRWGVIADHPIKQKLVKNKLTPKRHVPTRTEINEALTVAPDLIQCYVAFKMLTGLRQADILQLRKSDIKNDGIHVTPSKTQHSSGKSMIIEWDSYGELKRCIQRIYALKRPVKSIWVFCNRKGQPYFQNGDASGFQSIWQRWMIKALKETQLETRFTDRSLRTFVANQFETPEEAARLLGHADVKTTKSHYRVLPEKVLPLTKRR